MVIAAAAMEDVPAIVALEREAVEAPHWPPAAYFAIIADAEGPLQRCLLIARREGELAGFAVGRVLGDEAELESVAVRSTQRRTGIGQALCAAVVTWAWAQGATAVDLEVRASSAGVIALYRGLGFAVTGERREYYTSPVEDAVLMRLTREA